MTPNGVWTFGASSVSDYVRRTRDYTLIDVAHQITTPTLIFDPENDACRGEPRKVYDALACPATLVSLPENEGGGEHCSYGGRTALHQHMFDWLDITMPTRN